MKRLLASTALVALSLTVTPCRADAGPDSKGWWIMPGLALADGIHDGPDGFVSGFELSVVRNNRAVWFGVVDGLVARMANLDVQAHTRAGAQKLPKRGRLNGCNVRSKPRDHRINSEQGEHGLGLS